MPPMPSLPTSRVTPSAPFTFTGLDYLGPLYVKWKNDTTPVTKIEKIWICLLTCLSTRAVHLELIEDMTWSQFLLGLQRLIARRGKPSMIISDNAPLFKLVKSAIDKIWKRATTDDSVATYLSNENIKWKFITQRAPWMGGFHERLVRPIKQCLRKSLGKLCLSFIQLLTVITEIEAVINSRPLAYVGSDFASNQVITPAHFLSLNVKTGIPVSDVNELKDVDYIIEASSKQNLIKGWQCGQRHLETFWKLWRNDYLLSLRERYQNRLKQSRCCSPNEPKVGGVIQIYGDGPRGSWQLGRIIKLNKGSDGKIRTPKIITPSGFLTNRALMHLYPLECSDVEEVSETPIQMDTDDTQVTETRRRPTRAASQRAAKKI